MGLGLGRALLLGCVAVGCRGPAEDADLRRRVDELCVRNAALLRENQALARRLAVERTGGLRLFFPPGDLPEAPLEERLRFLERESELLLEDRRKIQEQLALLSSSHGK